MTVAGRDGAGRLGQESEELNINLSLNGEPELAINNCSNFCTEKLQSECSVANITNHVMVFGKGFRRVLIKWKVNLLLNIHSLEC